MSGDLSWQPFGDMVESIVRELHDRVDFDPDTWRIVNVAIAVAANNARVIGMREMAA